MDPNQPTPPPQQQPQPDYSVDYLNQIAAPVKPTFAPSPLILLGVIGVGVLAIVGFAILMFGSSGTSSLERMAGLNLRLASLQKIADTQQRQLRDNNLRSINAAFSLYLSNTLRDIKDPIAKSGVNEKTVTKKLSADEATFSSDVNTKFEEAKLNVILDRTYAREMVYQIGVLRNMMATVHKNTGNTELKTALETSDPSFAQSARGFEEFAGSN